MAARYEGLPKDAIGQLKFKQARDIAELLAGKTRQVLPPTDFDLVVSVPTAARRYRSRGFDQSAELGLWLGKLLQTPRANVLARLGSARQVGHDRWQRLQQLEGAFVCTKPGMVADAKILLVDDVLTTGATLDEAAKTLKAAGAALVWGAVVAKH